MLSSPLIVKPGVPHGSLISANVCLVIYLDLLKLPFHGQNNAKDIIILILYYILVFFDIIYIFIIIFIYLFHYFK